MVIERGHIYRAKKPKAYRRTIFDDAVVDDRQVLYVDAQRVQFDSPRVRHGGRYPCIAPAKFEKWAGEDVTKQIPNGHWQLWDHYQKKKKAKR